MIQKNRLMNYSYIIYQNDEWFKFSLDSVLLANFVTLNLKCKSIVDLCCGNCAISMILSTITSAKIYGIELQKEIYDLGERSLIENKLTDKIKIINGDIKCIDNYFKSDSYDTVVCNPPYFNTVNEDFLNDNKIKSIARHEIFLNFDDVVKSALYLLKNGGNFAFVHRSERFEEIVKCLNKYNFSIKKIQFVYPKVNKNSNLVLIEAVKNGKVGMKILPPLIVHNEDNSYTNEISLLINKKE